MNTVIADYERRNELQDGLVVHHFGVRTSAGYARLSIFLNTSEEGEAQLDQDLLEQAVPRYASANAKSANEWSMINLGPKAELTVPREVEFTRRDGSIGSQLEVGVHGELCLSLAGTGHRTIVRSGFKPSVAATK